MTSVLPPPPLGRELSNPPSDGISNLRFSNYGDRLLVSSWDKRVRLYNAWEDVLLGEFIHGGPVLDCCFHDDSSCFSAGGDKIVRRLHFTHNTEIILGSHDEPVRCVEYSYRSGLLITGSWDKSIKCWDPRRASGKDHTPATAFSVPERVYSLSLAGYRLVVATAGRHVNVYDLRNMSEPEQRRRSSLKHQTRCVRCYPNGTGYALSSVEGGVAMEYFDPSEAGHAKRFTFQCHRHRQIADGRIALYPVNTIAFHPVYGTFATGGCDCCVNILDGDNKKKLCQYPKYPASIAALSFSRDGNLLAVASSYTFEFGDILHAPDAIYVRSVNDIEVRRRPTVYPNTRLDS